jgi:hypothetical protein
MEQILKKCGSPNASLKVVAFVLDPARIPGAMNEQEPGRAEQAARVGRDIVRPQDPRYADLLQRNFTKRFVGNSPGRE